MYTWSPNDLYFWRSTPKNKVFSNQNNLMDGWWMEFWGFPGSYQPGVQPFKLDLDFYLWCFCLCIFVWCIPWKSKTKQRIVFRIIHEFRIPDPTNGQSLVKLDFLGILDLFVFRLRFGRLKIAVLNKLVHLVRHISTIFVQDFDPLNLMNWSEKYELSNNLQTKILEIQTLPEVLMFF